MEDSTNQPAVSEWLEEVKISFLYTSSRDKILEIYSDLVKKNTPVSEIRSILTERAEKRLAEAPTGVKLIWEDCSPNVEKTLEEAWEILFNSELTKTRAAAKTATIAMLTLRWIEETFSPEKQHVTQIMQEEENQLLQDDTPPLQEFCKAADDVFTPTFKNGSREYNSRESVLMAVKFQQLDNHAIVGVFYLVCLQMGVIKQGTKLVSFIRALIGIGAKPAMSEHEIRNCASSANKKKASLGKDIRYYKWDNPADRDLGKSMEQHLLGL